MFHFAEPELNGFGVTTWTPGLTRSAQPLMCFGLPFRTAKTTTVSARDAVVALAVPVRVDEAGVDEQVDVVAGGEEDEVGLQAVRDRARLVGRRRRSDWREADARAVRASSARPG